MAALPARVAFATALAVFPGALTAQQSQAAGLQPLCNGKDLAGWHGQREFDPAKWAALPVAERTRFLADDAAAAAQHWQVVDGALVNDGQGPYLTTDREFGDAEYRLEYRTVAKADSGIYLRATPQVQIWDCTEAGGKWGSGADKGSGGLWNNEQHLRWPLVRADRPFGEWNTLRIEQLGERTWVWFNDQLTVDGVVMENYWDRKRPHFPRGPLQLQTHGGEIRFRNLQARDIPPAEANARLAALDAKGFAPVFDGKTFSGWQGDTDSYEIVDGAIRCRPGKGGNVFTAATYADFAARLQFRLPKGGNNGLAVRYGGQGDAAYAAMEIQVLDDSDPQYANLKPWQFHGSIYGLVPAQRGYLRPQGEWNFEEVVLQGTHVTVTLNGTTIVDADLAAIAEPMDGHPHPGKDRKDGHFGFCGHNDPVEFRDLRIKPR